MARAPAAGTGAGPAPAHGKGAPWPRLAGGREGGTQEMGPPVFRSPAKSFFFFFFFFFKSLLVSHF